MLIIMKDIPGNHNLISHKVYTQDKDSQPLKLCPKLINKYSGVKRCSQND